MEESLSMSELFLVVVRRQQGGVCTVVLRGLKLQKSHLLPTPEFKEKEIEWMS
jgi:hypothetical protein